MSQTPREPFLPLIRLLAQTYQTFEQFSAHHVRQMGLTPPQFDVVATLGNTRGMSCKDLSEKTLITKGTLTGVVDRLCDKGIVQRTTLEHDRRSVFVALTARGEALFEEAFPAHLQHMRQAFAAFDPKDYDRCAAELKRLRDAFAMALNEVSDEACE
ncbi:MAG: MarR family transcriptional regulator [Paludibacterium sp.]|uniref:MarR family winged helix-turn-helix transcriptional regulator n=1 Tax=Paludibacterium sp. TaxID=1917523 RepID=UPI0025FDA62C|nr:MarR family transcriptional regulator [Paludibacterium sp.]MBV8049449.1 MarR family transcriptional regulator [Paludibacterium sp.]MBV8645989.1 MarR family transcriptional regulator [Paludibacterium sp.]